MTLPELLSDSVRARIYIEVLLKKEATAQQLMEVTSVNRSTMSHHLSRFVSEKVLRVRVGSEKYHRSIKYYSINPDFSEEVILDPSKDPDGMKKRAFLESSAAHLQVISNLMLERVKTPRKKGAVTFTFSFLSDADASIWMEEYQLFQKSIQTRIGKRSEDASECTYSYIAFGGLTPTG
ncbi:MAG: winged helix-turn-helix domain-containing protein [Candidatus Thorarchaeota archaeon]|nr:winged helix-turn-helix domain-containing protein [Candidatus Thorarchaeota archaeon]